MNNVALALNLKTIAAKSEEWADDAEMDGDVNDAAFAEGKATAFTLASKMVLGVGVWMGAHLEGFERDPERNMEMMRTLEMIDVALNREDVKTANTIRESTRHTFGATVYGEARSDFARFVRANLASLDLKIAALTMP